MKVSIILALIGISMGNDRLRNFRRYQKSAKNSRKVSSRGDRIPSTLHSTQWRQKGILLNFVSSEKFLFI